MNSTKFLMGLVVALLIAILGMQYAQMHKSAQDEPEAVVTEQDELVLEQEARGGELMSGAEAEVERDALLMAEIEQMRRDMERLQGTNQNMEQELAVSSEEMQRMEMELRRNQRMHEARLREITEAPQLSTVTAVFPDQGFIVIGAGTSKNVRPGSEYSIRRGDRILARVIVTEEVDAEEAAAEIVPGSMIFRDDQSDQHVLIETGDHVVQLD